jgi:hypothetical protein
VLSALCTACILYKNYSNAASFGSDNNYIQSLYFIHNITKLDGQNRKLRQQWMMHAKKLLFWVTLDPLEIGLSALIMAIEVWRSGWLVLWTAAAVPSAKIVVMVIIVNKCLSICTENEGGDLEHCCKFSSKNCVIFLTFSL